VRDKILCYQDDELFAGLEEVLQGVLSLQSQFLQLETLIVYCLPNDNVRDVQDVQFLLIGALVIYKVVGITTATLTG
jgi:hypothetical protein